MAKQQQEVTFEEVVERRCGLDVHKKEIVATVSGTGIGSETRTFQSTTGSLTELKEWLLALGITHVAMESTGVYWKPVMNILEPGGFTIMVVNARHIKYVPGHKTDKKDSAWIASFFEPVFSKEVSYRDVNSVICATLPAAAANWSNNRLPSIIA